MSLSREQYQELLEKVMISDERHAQLDLQGKRFAVSHSLTLHRDKTSADDIRAMLEALTEAGMPGTATLKVDGEEGHTRMNARWSTK